MKKLALRGGRRTLIPLVLLALVAAGFVPAAQAADIAKKKVAIAALDTGPMIQAPNDTGPLASYVPTALAQNLAPNFDLELNIASLQSVDFNVYLSLRDDDIFLDTGTNVAFRDGFVAKASQAAVIFDRGTSIAVGLDMAGADNYIGLSAFSLATAADKEDLANAATSVLDLTADTQHAAKTNWTHTFDPATDDGGQTGNGRSLDVHTFTSAIATAAALQA